jgi:hypothetical protein
MANITSISNKIARNAQILGLTVVSQGYDSFGNAQVTLAADVGNLTVSYLLAEIQYPMGGVNPMVSPYLGIGIANPGQLMLSSSVSTAGSMADIINGPISAQILAMLAWFDNDLVLANLATYTAFYAQSIDNISGLPASVGGAGAAYWVRLRGDSDLIGMGQ